MTVFLTAALTGCGGDEASGPDAAVERFVQLFNARELGEAYDSLASASPYRGDYTEEEFIREVESVYGDTPAAIRFSGFQATEVIIDGDTATVAWMATGVEGLRGDEIDSIDTVASVVQENGQWKILEPWNAAE